MRINTLDCEAWITHTKGGIYEPFPASRPTAVPHDSPTCRTLRLLPSCIACLHTLNGVTDTRLKRLSPPFPKLAYLASLSHTDSELTSFTTSPMNATSHVQSNFEKWQLTLDANILGYLTSDFHKCQTLTDPRHFSASCGSHEKSDPKFSPKNYDTQNNGSTSENVGLNSLL